MCDDVFVPGIVHSSGGIGAIASGDWRQLTKQVNFAPHARLSQITDKSRPDSEVRRNVLFSLVVVFSGRLLVYCGSHQFVTALLVYRREIIWPGERYIYMDMIGFNADIIVVTWVYFEQETV